MKTLNFNILQKFILVFCLSLFAISCSKDSVDFYETETVLEEENIFLKESNRDNFRYTPEQFSEIGVQHNLVLEQLYKKLKKDKDNHNVTIIDDKSLSDFLKKELSNSEYQIGKNIISQQTMNEFVETGIQTFREVKNVQDLKLNNEKIKNYMISLENIVKENIDVVSRIKSVESKIEKDLSLSNKDLYILFSATSVGKSSSEYWSQNTMMWLEELNTRKGTSNVQSRVSGDCSWWTLSGPNSCVGQLAGAVVIGDIIGAGTAALGALAVNVIIGPGQVAYGAAVLGGGVSTSAAAGAYWLLDHFN
ncbi:hypothetical protein [Aquimarina sp. LLG6339-5]|uniref:hypothetical protein n=1 Tax=Aquimarina sp. LLG6339-5 TaxID=3160830 RepID=UPI00386EBAC4